MTMWMVRAERKGILFDTFVDQKVCAIGWSEAGDLSSETDIEKIASAFRDRFPNDTDQSNRVAAGQVLRFMTEPKVGDSVITYSASRRIYAVGSISSDAFYDPSIITDGDRSWAYVRKVDWQNEVLRDDLSQKSRYSLGALLTFFQVKEFTEIEIQAALSGTPKPDDNSATFNDYSDAETELVAQSDIEERSIELIKDNIARISPNQMEHFVAGLLRALGYQTRVSPIGPDRGQDILATPDALGLQDPRIVVEVKHRRASIGAPDIRSFLGGRQNGDKGLYVSTGGFTKDAQYEADRANIPLRLMTLDDLVELVVAHYEELDVETRAMLPLKRIYWPLR